MVTVWVVVFAAEAVWVVVNGFAMHDELDEAEEDFWDPVEVGDEWIP